MSHKYSMLLVWTGNKGEGTATYRGYDRSFTVSIDNKEDFKGSSDPKFRGDPTKYNPEEMLVAALSSCHMLFYLHLCADNGIVATEYKDAAVGTMHETKEGGGFFTEVVLNITLKITDISKKSLAEKLNHNANQLCFIAASVNFPVRHNVTVIS
jgi:organic hydroperoxide reductase OsmC/OhrA